MPHNGEAKAFQETVTHKAHRPSSATDAAQRTNGSQAVRSLLEWRVQVSVFKEQSCSRALQEGTLPS